MIKLEVSSLCKEPTNHPIAILIAATLPRAVQFTAIEITLDPLTLDSRPFDL